MLERDSKGKGSLLGVAVGDALGATLEFMSQEEINCQYGLLKEIIGGGYWQLNPGEITDDTDMTIAVAKGILADPDDPIEHIAHFFVDWAQTQPKDIGKICSLVLNEGIQRNAKKEAEWLEIAEYAHELSGKRSGGNGSLMRTIPVVLAYLDNRDKMLQIAARQSALTHYDPAAGQCVILYCDLVRKIIKGDSLQEAIRQSVEGNLLGINYMLPSRDIKTSGYVVNTLEAALNCAYQTESFEDALIMAVNLGGDTDTIGAVTGGITGAYYGMEQIPSRWSDKIQVKEEILHLAQQLLAINYASKKVDRCLKES